MKRSDVTRCVIDLSRELGAPPGLEIIAARLGQDPKVMEAYLRALVGEGAIELSEGGYRVSVRTIGPTSQRELFQMAESGNHRQAEDTARFTPEELASIEESAKEGSDVQPSADDSAERAEVEGGDQVQEPDRKPVEPEPRRQERVPARRPQQKTRSSPSGLAAPVGRWQITVIRSVMAASGVGASVVSGYFAIARLGEFMPRGLAAILGAFIVAFAVIAFELVLVFVQRRSYFAAVTFVFLWAIVAVFTLNATIAGFYTYYTAVKHQAAAQEAPESASKNALDSLVSEESGLNVRIDVLTRDLQANERTIQNTTTSAAERSDYGRVFYDAQARIAADSKALDDLQNRLQVVREKERAILAATPAVAAAVKRVDYFEWAGGLLHWQPATMELVSAIFPSMFIDLISSIGLAVALFLSAETSKRRRYE